jgi:hypothetical protein
MKKNKKTNGQPSAKKPVSAARQEPTPDQIRDRAYRLFLQRGGQGGNPVEDWLTAERELRSGKS